MASECSKRTNIFGFPVEIGSKTAVISRITRNLGAFRGGYSIAGNFEKVLSTRADPLMREIVQRASLVVADGFPVAVIATLRALRRTERVDFPVEMLKVAAKEDLSVFLLGSTWTTVTSSKQMAESRFGCRVVGISDGFFEDWFSKVQEVAETDPDIVLVGMGSPKQEYFVEFASQTIKSAFFVPCGGALDILSGSKRRAPRMIQKLGLEWAFRMAEEPQRFKRILKKILFLKK